ncbi:helix-turn-helix domain-containing protein [Nonomuraea sp. NPDC050556]|uniref:helix-turn-helix domain-containing protein n=1 Tax=Nonomuraea sp. NPDC050556 TaxID=3364369 RepID=UPI0037AC20D6
MAIRKTSIKEPNGPLPGTPEVADYLGIPQKTLVQWRWRGVGPRYIKVGRHIRYRWADIEKWLDQNQGGGADVVA